MASHNTPSPLWSDNEPDAEPVQEPEPEPESGYEPDLPFIPMAEGLPMVDGRPWYLQPEPNWTRLSKDLGLAWPLHMYGIGCAFTLLAIISACHLVLIYRSKRTFAKPYYVTLHALLLLCGITRSIHYLCDPYHSNGRLPLIVVFISLHTYDPSILSSFILVFAAIIKVTRMMRVSKRLFHPVFLVSIIAVNFLVTWTADIVVAYVMSAIVYMFVCKLYFVIMGILASGLYIYLFCRVFNRVYITRVKINRMIKTRSDLLQTYEIPKGNRIVTQPSEYYTTCDASLAGEAVQRNSLGPEVRPKQREPSLNHLENCQTVQYLGGPNRNNSEVVSEKATESKYEKTQSVNGENKMDKEYAEDSMHGVQESAVIPQMKNNIGHLHAFAQHKNNLSTRINNDLIEGPICNTPDSYKSNHKHAKSQSDPSPSKSVIRNVQVHQQNDIEARVPLAAKLVLLSASIFFVITCCNIILIIMAAFHMCENPDKTPESWYWWSYQTLMRLLELSMATIIVVIGSMPIYRKGNA